MSWNNPITWGVQAVTDVLFNSQIRDNMKVLHAGNGQPSTPAAVNVAVANTLDISDEEETFLVSANYNLSYISTTGRAFGNRIHLIKSDSGVGEIKYGESSAPAGYAPIYANGLGTDSLSWNEGRMVTLVYSGYGWHQDRTP